jgi:foldase protein PrsA
MRQLTIFLALCALLVPAAAVAGCGDDGVPTTAVAEVDGEAIDLRSFDHWLTVAARSSGRADAQIPEPPDYAACVEQKRKAQPAQSKATDDAQFKQQCAQEYDALRDQALQLLISSRWIEAEASDRSISVDDSEVKEAFDRQRKLSFRKDADFQAFLESSGQTEQDILTRVRLDLLSRKIGEQVTKVDDEVTDEQIADRYRENKARFVQPERRDLRIVLTRTESAAKRAMSALADGEGWSSVAKRHSTDTASKSRGGRVPGVTRGGQEKALDEAVFSASKGNLTGPIKTKLGYYVFEVTDVKRASQQTLEQAGSTISEQLIAERQQKQLASFTERFRKKWRDKTECREGFATPDCRNGPKATPTPAQQTSGAAPPAPQP